MRTLEYLVKKNLLVNFNIAKILLSVHDRITEIFLQRKGEKERAHIYKRNRTILTL